MLTPLKAIRAWCLDCSGRQWSEVKKCVIPDCPLYPYRFGKNPNRSGIGPKNGRFKQNSQTQVGGLGNISAN
jgi:hypothetical protein